MKNVFLETMASLASEDKYLLFRKRLGKPTFLNEEMLDIGQKNFVPFVNTGCNKSTCIYDLSHIEEMYEKTYDSTDAFKGEGGFHCHYCDQFIQYGKFITSQTLTDDVEELFSLLSHQRMSSMKKATPRQLDTPGMNRRKVILQNNLLQSPVLPFTQAVRRESMAKALQAGTVRRRDNRSKSALFDWNEIKYTLKTYAIPEIDAFNPLDGERKSREMFEDDGTKYKLSADNPSVYPFSKHMDMDIPPLEEISKAMVLESLSLYPFKSILFYWRSLYCRHSNRLMAVWLFEVIKSPQGGIPQCRCTESIMADGKIVLYNMDSYIITFIIKFNDTYFFIEYHKIDGKVKFINFEPSNSKVSKQDILKFSDTAFYYLRKINQDLLGNKLELGGKEVVDLPMDGPRGGSLSHYIMQRIFPQSSHIMSQPAMVTRWILANIGLMSPIPQQPRKSIMAPGTDGIEEKELTVQPELSQKTLPALELIPSSVPRTSIQLAIPPSRFSINSLHPPQSITPRAFPLKSTPTHRPTPSLPQMPKISPQKTIPKARVDKTTRSNKARDTDMDDSDDSDTLARRYEGVHRLLRIYSRLDRDRYSHLVNRCTQGRLGNRLPRILHLDGIERSAPVTARGSVSIKEGIFPKVSNRGLGGNKSGNIVTARSNNEIHGILKNR